MRERVEYIDNAKALLILLVVIGHELIYANPQYNILPYTLAQGFIYSFHMPAFFLITGILFSNERWKDQTWRSFLSRRVKTLLVPYGFFELIAILYKHFVLGTVSLTEGLYNLVTLRCNVGADWFLPALFLTNVFFFLYVKHPNKLVGAAAAVACLFSTWFLPAGNWWNTLCRGMLGFGFIFLGNVLKRYLTAFKAWAVPAAFLLTAIFSAISFLFAHNDFYGCTVDHPLLFAAGGICGLYFILGISRYIHFKWLRLLGENSLVVMGTHQLVLYTIPTSSSVLWVAGAFALIALVEAAVIYVTNTFCPFLIGKRRT